MTREEIIEFAIRLKNNFTIDFDDLPDFCDSVIEGLSDEWLTTYLEHQLEVLEQDISEQRMFGNNYLIGKRAAYNDIYKMLRGDE